MKRGLLLLISLFMMVSTVGAMENTKVSDHTGDFNPNFYANEAIEFNERGIQFYVFLDGTFDFNTEATAEVDYVKHGRRSGNYYEPRGIRIERDYYGNIRRIGNVFINYGRNDKVKRIGNVFIQYRHDKMKKVGNLKIHYTRHSIYFTGSVKQHYNSYNGRYNPYYSYGWSSFNEWDMWDTWEYSYYDPFFEDDDFYYNYENFDEDEDFYYFKSKAKKGKRSGKSKVIKRRKANKSKRSDKRKKVANKATVSKKKSKRIETNKQEQKRKRGVGQF